MDSSERKVLDRRDFEIHELRSMLFTVRVHLRSGKWDGLKALSYLEDEKEKLNATMSKRLEADRNG